MNNDIFFKERKKNDFACHNVIINENSGIQIKPTDNKANSAQPVSSLVEKVFLTICTKVLASLSFYEL